MTNKNLLGFDEFSSNNLKPLNEMASELTKLGVPKDLMVAIHKLSGKMTPRSQGTFYGGDKFHTKKEPNRARLGPWPESEDIPMSHDVQVKGTKKGKNQIYHYLTNVLDSRKDSKIRMILSNPDSDMIIYLTRKTGKMSKDQLSAEGLQGKSREELRELGVAQKLGLYVRSVAIDADSGQAISGWDGTISQMAEDMTENSVLYIMEDEDKVRSKRKVRTKRNTVAPEAFVEYFIDNYSKILDSQGKSNASKLNDKIIQKLSGLSANDIADVVSRGWDKENVRSNNVSGEGAKKMREILDLKKAVEESIVDSGNIQSKLWSFLELAFKEGEYEPDVRDRNKASLSDMVDKHTMPIVASMFLQFIALGKVHKPFYSDDPFKELGLDDLMF
jgi:hypothetical protein